MKLKLPKEVQRILETIEKSGYKAYLVGGCVRDLILGRAPKDWDIATDIKPDGIQKIFKDSVYENQFGTVGVKTDSSDEKLKLIEVTTFRTEEKYTDKRHPDEVKFAKTIEEDLSRRDFTINAMAMNLEGELTDPFSGKEDLKAKLIRTVGKPKERFNEDALRLIRAVRFASQLGFKIDKDTSEGVKSSAGLLEAIAKERIRDEFEKIIMSDGAKNGILKLEELNLLQFVAPEIREGIGCGQNKHHIYDVFEHNLRALDYSAGKNYSLIVRLASFLHDVGKPRTKRGDGPDSTFYNHEVVGARIALKIMDRLKFSKSVVESVAHLVRHHLFYYNVGEVTESGVRRFLSRVGTENIDDLMKVREADRIGSGVPKAFPYKLRHLLFMIEKVKHDPIHPKMLKIKGDGIMELLKIPPGERIGKILSILLEEVIDDPKKNTETYLEERILNLGKLDDLELSELANKARERKEEFESGIEEEMKKKHYVK